MSRANLASKSASRSVYSLAISRANFSPFLMVKAILFSALISFLFFRSARVDGSGYEPVAAIVPMMSLVVSDIESACQRHQHRYYQVTRKIKGVYKHLGELSSCLLDASLST